MINEQLPGNFEVGFAVKTLHGDPSCTAGGYKRRYFAAQS